MLLQQYALSSHMIDFRKNCVFGKYDVFIQGIRLWFDLWYIHKHGEYLLGATANHAIQRTFNNDVFNSFNLFLTIWPRG